MSHEILYPDTDYTNLILRWGINNSLDIYSKDKDGDVMLESNHYDERHTIYLDQEGIKLLIEHLQKQLK